MSEDPKKLAGSLKPSMHYVPMNVMIGVSRVFELGASKYGLKNWRKQPVAMSTYYSAIHRHLVQFFEVGVDKDQESQQHHLDHIIASCMILRDGIDRNTIIDDRFDYEVKTGEQAPDQFGKIVDYKISNGGGLYGGVGGGSTIGGVEMVRIAAERQRRHASSQVNVDASKLLDAIEEDVIERPKVDVKK